MPKVIFFVTLIVMLPFETPVTFDRISGDG